MTVPPTTEPSSIVVGDSLTFTKTVSDYPASAGWTLSYSLQNNDREISFAATASGDNYSINIPPATTSTWAPGDYVLIGFVNNGTDRHTVSETQVVVVPDPSISRPTTHAVRTLSLIEAAIEGRIPKGMESATIDGQAINLIPIDELVKLRSLYRDYVKNEIAQDRINRGLNNPRNSFARFRRQGAALRPPFSPPYA